MFKLVLLFSIEKSHLSQTITEFSKVSSQSPFARLIYNLTTQSNLSRLAKKIMKWFDESKGSAKSFDYRFTGQESRRFLHNFMSMISAIEADNDSRQVSMKLHIFAFAILSLRNAVFPYLAGSILMKINLMNLTKNVTTFSPAVLCFLKSTQQCGQ